MYSKTEPGLSVDIKGNRVTLSNYSRQGVCRRRKGTKNSFDMHFTGKGECLSGGWASLAGDGEGGQRVCRYCPCVCLGPEGSSGGDDGMLFAGLCDCGRKQ